MAIENIDVSWEGYSGNDVEAFIKSQLSSKVGYLYVTPEKQTDNLYHIKGFASRENFEAWEQDPENLADLVLVDIKIPDQASTAASYIVSLKYGSDSYIVSTDGSVKVKVRFTSVLYSPIDQSTSDTNEGGVLTLQTRLTSSASWTTRGTIPVQSLPQNSENYTEIDISSLLANGEQQVRLIVKGEVSEQNTSYIQFTAVKTVLALRFANSWEVPIRDEYMPLSFFVNGAVAKSLNIEIDGVRTLTYNLGTSVYTEAAYSTDVYDNEVDSPVVVHGIHTVKAWLSVNNTSIISDIITAQVLVIKDPSDTTPYLILNDVKDSLTNWTQETLFKYAVYNPLGSTLPVTFTLSDYNVTTEYLKLSLDSVSNGIQYSFTNMIEIESTDPLLSAYMSIKTGDTDLTERLPFEVDNTNNFAPTANPNFYLNPKLRSNDDGNPDTIINASNKEIVPSTFNGFGWVRDGWVTDESGQSCLRVLAGKSVEIDYEAFSAFTDKPLRASTTIEIDFATRNITDENTPILRMCSYGSDGLPLGFEMKPLEACFMTLNKTVRLDQDIMFQEDVRTHIAINIVYNLGSRGKNYIRLFVNGVINREIDFDDTDDFLRQISGLGLSSQGIRIGAEQAEIDIYSIRIYKRALSSSDIQQDYVASLPTSELKLAFRDANDILGDDNTIDYEKTKAKYNTMLWKYNSKQNPTRLATYGDASKQLQYGDLEVNIIGDPDHSGTLFNMNTQGQGTSSMSYWKWNQRIQFDDDGYFVNQNGVRYDGCYQLADGIPFATRLDGKLNWASSMQSHKCGAVDLYQDLWDNIVGENTLTLTEGGQDFTGTINGYSDCRVTVKQKPFLMFVQADENSAPVFYGLYTWGPGKGDKPTFGYNKKVFPDFTMLEGCDNGLPLVMHKVPWDDDVTGSQDDELWQYNGADSWEISIGSGNLWEEFRDTFNFIYLHHTDIKPFIGNLTGLKADTSVDKTYHYWVTVAQTGSAQFDLYRYDILTMDWIPAGINKTSLNINEQCGKLASGVDWDAINKTFVAWRISDFKNLIGNHFDVNDLFFTMCFMTFFACSDNRGKNTYLYKIVAGDKIRFFQDDLDSMMRSNNVGRKTKPYWVEVHDYGDDGQPHWTSTENALYNLTEQAFPDELRSMMNTMLATMTALGGSVEGCLKKYFFSIQQYFPAVAYNEIARLLYEDAAVAMMEGRYQCNTLPLPQSLGDQLQSELGWAVRRVPYMSSYASYGEFASGEVPGALAFRSIKTLQNQSPSYDFTLTPHQWLYPAIGRGDSVVFGAGNIRPARVKAGEKITLRGITSDGDTNMRVLGINYMRDIGTFGEKPLGQAFSLSGKRLLKFIASGENPEFRPTSFTPASVPNIEEIDLTGVSVLTGGVNISNLYRLKTFLAKGTSLKTITFPSSDALESIELPTTLESLTLDNQPNLKNASLFGAENLATLIVDQNKVGSVDVYRIVYATYAAYLETGKKILSYARIYNINWSEITTAFLDYLIDITDIKISGRIEVSSNAIINSSMKQRLINKFGNVDDPNHSIYITYTPRPIQNLGVSGASYLSEVKDYQYSALFTPTTANAFTSIKWSIDSADTPYATINPDTGVLTPYNIYDEDVPITITVTCTITKTDGQIITASKKVGLYNRSAKVGDYVFNDGSYGPELDEIKTPIGICFYINPNDKTDRRAIGFELIRLNGAADINWGLHTASIPGIKLADAPNYNVYDVPIPNINTLGISGAITLDNYCDLQNESNDLYKLFGNSTAVGYGMNNIQDDGLIEVGEYGYLAGLPETARIPISKYHTLAIIAHRNKILEDSSVGIVPPEKIGSRSEFQDLEQKILEFNAANGGSTNYSQYFYPSASACYAYEPDVPGLADKFKAHQWYLALPSEMLRIWFLTQYSSPGVQVSDGIFADAIKNGIISSANKLTASTYLTTSLESGEGTIIFVLGGKLNSRNKATTQRCYPIVNF